MAFGRLKSLRCESAFALYLRTGYRVAAGVECKFNPWHDTEDGRFTFVGQGRFYPKGSRGQDVTQRDREAGAKLIREDYGGRRKPSERDPYVPDRSDLDARHPQNWTTYVVRPGDTLIGIAKKRTGLTANDLAWLNGIPLNQPLQISQKIKLPTQRSLDAGIEAYQKSIALMIYMDTHSGKLPPVGFKPSYEKEINKIRRHYIANGYNFYVDVLARAQHVTANLYLGDGGRSKKIQGGAGGVDRLASDQGGHIIGRQFNGPRFDFNHFAQDASFNKKAYARLEAGWAAQKKRKRQVYLDVHLFYKGASRRPHTILVEYWVDGQHYKQKFPNSPQANEK